VMGNTFQGAVARDCAWLLLHPELDINLSDLKGRYLARLITMGLANRKGSIQMDDLHCRFIDFIGSSVLADLDCSIEKSKSHQNTWLAKTMRNPHKEYSPIHHVLILHFLQIDVRTLIDPIQSPSPFGDGPWPCLNHASSHYGTRKIENISISVTNRGQSIRGVFHCPGCGMVYERLGPDGEEADRWRWDSVPTYGHVWEQMLGVLWRDRSVSLRAASRRLGVDPNTVIRQIKRLGIHQENARPTTVRWERITFTQPLQGPQSDPSTHKEVWRSLREQYPCDSVTELRTRAPATYAFLYRHELMWLRSQIPGRQATLRGGGRFDWRTRDDIVHQLVMKAGRDLRRRLPPVQLTLKAILVEAGCRSITSKNLRHMPKTEAILKHLREDRCQFALRTIRSCASRMREERQLSYHSLLQESNIGRTLLRYQDVQNALMREITDTR
jgi:hypothetical protein